MLDNSKVHLLCSTCVVLQLRKQMIDGEEGTVAIESFQVLDDEVNAVLSV